MAFQSAQTPVTPNATEISVPFPNSGGSLSDVIPYCVRNLDASLTVYLGGPTVTTSNGFPLKPGESIPFTIGDGGELYGVIAGTRGGLTISAVSTAEPGVVTTSGASGLSTGQTVTIEGVVSQVDVSAVSTANPGVVTTTQAHGLATGDTVTITAVGGATQANGTWVVTVVDANNFSIPVNVTGTYTSGGEVAETAQINGTWVVTVVDSTDFSLNGSNITATYVSGGTAVGSANVASLTARQ